LSEGKREGDPELEEWLRKLWEWLKQPDHAILVAILILLVVLLILTLSGGGSRRR
jgi:hypothetical protein